MVDQYESTSSDSDRTWWLVGGVLAGGMVLICLCAGGWLFLAQRRLAPNPIPSPPAVPTLLITPLATAATPSGGPAPTQPGAPTITLRPAATVPPPDPATNITAVRLDAPPAIDGDLREWGNVGSIQSSFRVFNRADWDGSEDLTAVWRLGWDADNLYVATAVRDDIHVQTQTGNTTYRGDSLEMQIDTDRAADYGPRLSPDDVQFVFSPGDFDGRPPEAYRFRGNAAGEIPDAPGHNAVVAARQTADGYTLEAVIPWSDLGVQPEEGLVLGLSLNANDNDTPGTAAQEVMMSTVSGRRLTDPTTWGTLTLR